jgi:mannitol 2-dehydrogenase
VDDRNAARREPAQPLCDATLAGHRGRGVAVPDYDRAALRRSVVHLGVGGVHRAHQGVDLDDLARYRVSADCGVTGVSLHHRRASARASSRTGARAW